MSMTMNSGSAVQSPLAHGRHDLIGSDRVEGTNVYRSDGKKIGEIERVMIDKMSGQAAYAVMGFGGFLGAGVPAEIDAGDEGADEAQCPPVARASEPGHESREPARERGARGLGGGGRLHGGAF